MDTSIHHSTVKLEDMTNQVQVPSDNVSHTNALSMAHVSDVMSDMSDDPSSPESTTFVDSDLLTTNGKKFEPLYMMMKIIFNFFA